MGRIDDIVAEATASGESTEPELESLQRVQAGGVSELDKLLDILENVNQAPAVKNAVKWFWCTSPRETIMPAAATPSSGAGIAKPQPKLGEGFS